MGNIAHPELTVLNFQNSQNAAVSDSNISIHGVTIGYLGTSSSSLRIGSATALSYAVARFDSLVDCIIQPSIYICVSYSTIFARCKCYGGDLHIGDAGPFATNDQIKASTLPFITRRVQMHDCTIPNLLADGHIAFQSGFDQYNFDAREQSINDSLLLRNCTMAASIPSDGSGGRCFRFFFSPNAVLDQCHITMVQNCLSGDEVWAPFAVRDSSVNFTMNCDTVMSSGAGDQEVLISHSGNLQYFTTTTIDSCWFSNTSGTLMYWQNGMKGATIKWSTFSTQDNCAMQVGAYLTGPNVIDHNTFATNHYHDLWGPPFGSFDILDHTVLSADTTKFYDNIIYSSAPYTANDCYNSQTGCSRSCGIYLPFDGSNIPNLLKMDWNLYEFLPYKDSKGDRSIGMTDGGYDNSKPGAANHLMNHYANSKRLDADSLSVFGDAQLDYGSMAVSQMVNGVQYSAPLAGPTLDAHIGAGSAARGAGKDSSDIGAVAWNSTPTVVMYSQGAGVMQLSFRTSSTRDTVFALKNAGGGTLHVSLYVSGESGLVLSPTTMTLAAGERLPVQAVWTTTRAPGHQLPLPTHIYFTTDDPANPRVNFPVAWDENSGKAQDQQ